MNFTDLGLDEKLLRAVTDEGYTTPTPIQLQAIPILLEGGDLIGCAQTGTGKTAAFSLPLLQRLMGGQTDGRHRTIRALIVAPTRELAIQIDQSLKAYGRHTGLRSTVVFGGVSAGPQIDQLRRGIDILTATPGRLLDLHNQGEVNLDQVSILVLDEGDRMLDMGFLPDVKRIIARLPERRQTLLFSATMPPEVREIADKYLRRPREITVAPPREKQGAIRQSVYFAEKNDKPALLAALILGQQVEKGIVFTRTKHGADKLAKKLAQASINTGAIHGNKSQNHRQRVLEDFRQGRIHILVASDIAARGIDIDDISHIFNFELPEVPETYIHRIGRTARAGATGIAISLCSDEERKYLHGIQKLTGKIIPVATEHPDISIVPTAVSRPAERPARRQPDVESTGPDTTPRPKDGQKGGNSRRRGSSPRNGRSEQRNEAKPEKQTRQAENTRNGQPDARKGNADGNKRRNNDSRQDANRSERRKPQEERRPRAESAEKQTGSRQGGRSTANGQNRSRNQNRAKGKPKNEQPRPETNNNRDPHSRGAGDRRPAGKPEAEKKSWFARWIDKW